MKKACISLFLVLCLIFSTIPALAMNAEDLLADAQRYAQEGAIEKALACCELVQRLNADDPAGFVKEAEILLASQNLAGARRAVQAALAVDPVCETAWRMMCELDIAEKDISAFEEDFLFASVLHVNFGDLWGDIAAMYVAAGRNETAISYYEKMDFEGLDENQRALYAAALKRSGQLDRAEALGLARIPTRDAALDAAFAQDRLALVPAAALPFGSVATWYSLSPGGNSGILGLDGSDAPVSMYNGFCHWIRPSTQRGVADEYGNLEKYYQYITSRFPALLGSEGVVYSPDGRYAAILNGNISLMNANFFIDPILLDLFTGELILTATYQNKPGKPNCGTCVTACFSPDGRYFYSIIYGNVLFRSTLCRYDLLEQRTEVCLFDPEQAFSEDEEERYAFLYYPRLSITADGDLLILKDTRFANETRGVMRISNSGEHWRREDSMYLRAFDGEEGEIAVDEALLSCGLGVDENLWSLEELSFPAGSPFQARQLCYSLNSERALVLGYDGSGNQRIFMSLDFAAEVSGLDCYWAIDADSHRAVSLSAQESPQEVPYLTIAWACLSPDGHYALILARNDETQEANLFMLRLEDMELRAVKGLSAADIAVGVSARYRPVIEWNGDILIIGTKEGPQTYRFQGEEQQ